MFEYKWRLLILELVLSQAEVPALESSGYHFANDPYNWHLPYSHTSPILAKYMPVIW